MSLKTLVSLVTYASDNEQAGITNRTISATGTTFSREFRELGNFNRGMFYFDCSAISGSGAQIVCKLQHQDPISTKWVDVSNLSWTASAVSGDPTTHAPVSSELYGLNYRASFVVTGTTPSITFSLCCVAGSEEPVI